MNFRNEGIMPFEVEVLFRQILNLDQIKHISNLLIILGKYMVLDRSMINERAEMKIGLSYIQKARETRLIAEYQNKDEMTVNEYYFFSLAPGGIYFLESEGFPFHKLPKYTNQQHRERILTFNHFALNKGYSIDSFFPQDKKFNFFITEEKNNKKAILFFKNMITEEEIKEAIENIIFEKNLKIPMDIFEFKEIKMPLIKIGKKSETII